jgi:hypothetical protein
MFGTAPNWDASGNAGYGIQSVTNGDALFGVSPLPAPGDGTNYVYLNMTTSGGVPYQAYCWEDVGPLQSNTTYTLTVAVGQSLQMNTGIGVIALVNGQGPFQPLLGDTVINLGTNWTPGTFSNLTLTYTTGAQVSGDLTILLRGDSGQQLIFDNVRLDAVSAANPTATLPVFSSPSTLTNSVVIGNIAAVPTNAVYVGTVVTLTENAAGTGALTYQWLSDNGTGGATFTPISGATGAALQANTSGFTNGESVEYEVTVTSGANHSTSPPVILQALQGPPVLITDTTPSAAADDVGSQIRLVAGFNGSGPLKLQWMVDTGSGPAPIAGATNDSLTLTNLQATDQGSYTLLASNSFGTLASDPCALTVNIPLTNSADGVVLETAYQLGLGSNTVFTPTWQVQSGSLIAGQIPTNLGSSIATFQLGASGGVGVLTDGKAGFFPPAGNGSASLATAGTGGGTYITFSLPTNAQYGWTITNVVVYGGWSDAGRIEQEYDMFYSTYVAPNSFNSQINAGGSVGGYAGVDFQYPSPTSIDPTAFQCATRTTVFATNGSALAKNVVDLQFNFNIPAKAPENGWEGYGEIQVFGTPSSPSVIILSNTSPQVAGDIEGSSITFNAAFSFPSALSYQWMVNNGNGPTPIPGATNTSLTLTNLQLSDTGSYNCLASNGTSSALTTPASLTVNANPGADSYGVVDAPAFQAAGGLAFNPTWVIPPGSLIAGMLPTDAGSGNFGSANQLGGVNVLTDGQFGPFSVTAGDVGMVSAGPNAGTSLTYVLALSNAPAGYDITNIQVYGGWNDQGRDQQAYYITAIPVTGVANSNQIINFTYQPPNVGAIPTATRVTYTAANGGALATNVGALYINFFAGENGWEGYAEIAVYGKPSAGTATVPPFLTADILPFVASDVVGSSVTFKSAFDSSAPIVYQWTYADTNNNQSVIAGATGPTLTLANLQLTNAGSYFVTASNALGQAATSAATLTVNPVPPSTNGILQVAANQQTYTGGPTLFPTWTLAPADLLMGLSPSSSSGNFAVDGCGGTPVLTDGSIGYLGAGVGSLASGGNGAEGSNVVYTLTGSPNGYNITQLVTYGGWTDGGRDEQSYTFYYATAQSPSNWIPLTTVVYLPPNPHGYPDMSRVTTSSTSGPLAQNVVAVRFNFATPGGENGWEGYSELALYGTAASAPLSFATATVSGGNLVLAGSGGTAGAAYTILSSTNVLGPWVTNTAGTFNQNGGFSNAIPVSSSIHSEFFRVQVP